jgi:small GTP-binding protein
MASARNMMKRGTRSDLQGGNHLKMAVLGDVGAGKTSLLRRFVTNTFEKRYESTSGCMMHTSSVRYEGETITMDLWDTPGGHSFATLAEGFHPSPVQNAHGVLIIYDMTSTKSLNAAKRTATAMAKHGLGKKYRCQTLLVGTKVDQLSESKHAAATKRAAAFAKERRLIAAEVSCSTGHNTMPILAAIVEMCIEEQRRHGLRRPEGSAEAPQPEPAPAPAPRTPQAPAVPPELAVPVWLEARGLGEYAEAFVHEGYEGPACVDELRMLEPPQLQALCGALMQKLQRAAIERQRLQAQAAVLANGPAAGATESAIEALRAATAPGTAEEVRPGFARVFVLGLLALGWRR